MLSNFSENQVIKQNRRMESLEYDVDKTYFKDATNFSATFR